MKWRDKKGTRCVDLDRVGYWDYSPPIATPTEMGSAIIIVVDGYEIKFFGEDADSLYGQLSNKKEVL